MLEDILCLNKGTLSAVAPPHTHTQSQGCRCYQCLAWLLYHKDTLHGAVHPAGLALDVTIRTSSGGPGNGYRKRVTVCFTRPGKCFANIVCAMERKE